MYADMEELKTRSMDQNKTRLTIINDPYEACKDAHVIAILTEWDEFKTIDWQRIYDNMKKPVFVFDGRLIIDALKLEEIGFEVCRIGNC